MQVKPGSRYPAVLAEGRKQKSRGASRLSPRAHRTYTGQCCCMSLILQSHPSEGRSFAANEQGFLRLTCALKGNGAHSAPERISFPPFCLHFIWRSLMIQSSQLAQSLVFSKLCQEMPRVRALGTSDSQHLEWLYIFCRFHSRISLIFKIKC